MITRNVNINRYDDEYALFGKALPYIAMMIGAGLVFVLGVIIRLGMYAQAQWGNTPVLDSARIVTFVIIGSSILLTALAWRLFKSRDQFHHHISLQAAVTTILAHGWLIVAVWQDMYDWMFGSTALFLYFFGAAVLGLSWCIRRWAYRDPGDSKEGGEGGLDSVFTTIGLGKAQGPEKTAGRKLLQGINSFWTWTRPRLSKMLKVSYQKSRIYLRNLVVWFTSLRRQQESKEK
jgi:hypothetical protein